MNSTKKCKSAMITVELAVSLVLIVVVIFVALGMFGDNVKTMVTASNFNNLMGGNSQRTFFSNFKRDYKDAQVQVQVMGEQGLEMLRQKANNNELVLLDKILAAPNPSKQASASDVDTMAYLGLVITAIVGDSRVCQKMDKPSKEKCGANGVPEPEYTLDLRNPSKIVVTRIENPVTYSFKGSNVTLAAMDLSGKNSTDQTYTVIGALTNSYTGLINTTLGLFGTSNVFSTGLAASSTFESKLMNFLADNPNVLPKTTAENEYVDVSLIESLKEAKHYCNGMRDFWSWVAGASNSVFGTDYSTPCVAGGVNQQDIESFLEIAKDPLVVKDIVTYAKNAEAIAKTGSPTSSSSSSSGTSSGGGGGGSGNCGKLGGTECNTLNYQSNLHIEKSIYSANAAKKIIKANIATDNTFVMGYKELDDTKNMISLLEEYAMCSYDGSTYGEVNRSCTGGGGGGYSGYYTTTTSSSSSSTTTSSSVQCYDQDDDIGVDCSFKSSLLYKPKTSSTTTTSTTVNTNNDDGVPVYTVTVNSEEYVIRKATVDDASMTNDSRLIGTYSTVLRSAITVYYAKMLDTIWAQNSRIIPILKKDQVTTIKDQPRETSCKLYLSSLSKIADIIGLVQYRDLFNAYYSSTMCDPDVNIVPVDNQEQDSKNDNKDNLNDIKSTTNSGPETKTLE